MVGGLDRVVGGLDRVVVGGLIMVVRWLRYGCGQGQGMHESPVRQKNSLVLSIAKI